MHRNWGKARKPALAAWEEHTLNDDIFNAGRTTKVIDAVWRVETRAEAAASLSKHYLMIFWDLVKAFEHVQHHILIKQDEMHTFPMGVLRLLMLAYRWQRALCLSGATAEPLWPN